MKRQKILILGREIHRIWAKETEIYIRNLKNQLKIKYQTASKISKQWFWINEIEIKNDGKQRWSFIIWIRLTLFNEKTPDIGNWISKYEI